MKKSIFFTILVGVFLTVGQSVLAQSLSVGISPLTFELSGNPGDVIVNKLKVYNPSTNRVGVKMDTEDIVSSGESGNVLVEPAETETYSLAQWVKITPKEFVLSPKEQKIVSFTISVPKNAEPGGHYGTILASTESVSGPKATGATIVQRVGSLVLLTVPGKMKEGLLVKRFTAPHYSEYGPIPFTIVFKNTGTVHVKPTGFITITDWWGKKVADLRFPSHNILPNGVRLIKVSFPKKWLWAGKYTATLSGSYGPSTIHLTPSVVTFWAFPWKVGLGVLIVLLLLFLIRKRWIAAFRILIKGER